MSIRRSHTSVLPWPNATAGTLAVSKKALVDPLAIRILRLVSQQAVKDAPTAPDDLLRQAKDNGDKLVAAAAGTATDDELKMLRTYCLALSRALASFQQSRQEHLKPLNRIRR